MLDWVTHDESRNSMQFLSFSFLLSFLFLSFLLVLLERWSMIRLSQSVGTVLFSFHLSKL